MPKVVSENRGKTHTAVVDGYPIYILPDRTVIRMDGDVNEIRDFIEKAIRGDLPNVEALYDPLRIMWRGPLP